METATEAEAETETVAERQMKPAEPMEDCSREIESKQSAAQE